MITAYRDRYVIGVHSLNKLVTSGKYTEKMIGYKTKNKKITDVIP